MKTKELKVLMLSTDQHSFVDGSAVQKRFIAYGNELEELHVLVIGSDHKEIKLSDNVWVHSVRTKSKTFGLFAGARIGSELVKKFDIKVVSAQDPFEIGWVGLRITDSTSAELHVQVHTDMLSPWFVHDSMKNKVRLRIADVVLRSAVHVRVVSDRIKKGLIAKYGSSVAESSVLPIVAPFSIGKPLTKSFPFTILSVGRLTKEKHLNIALEVLSNLQKSSSAIGLVFVGVGPEKRVLSAHARKLGIEDKVQFVGWTESPASWFATADCLLHTSAYEGYGRIFIEAALSGLPIVSTDVGIMRDVFVSPEDAIVCGVDDIECLSEGVRKVLNDAYVREEMPRIARRKAEAHVAEYEGYERRIAEDLVVWRKYEMH